MSRFACDRRSKQTKPNNAGTDVVNREARPLILSIKIVHANHCLYPSYPRPLPLNHLPILLDYRRPPKPHRLSPPLSLHNATVVIPNPTLHLHTNLVSQSLPHLSLNIQTPTPSSPSISLSFSLSLSHSLTHSPKSRTETNRNRKEEKKNSRLQRGQQNPTRPHHARRLIEQEPEIFPLGR